MNERMLELYRQAFVPHTTICPDNNMPYETVLFSTEKFAELIVKECIGCCEQVISDTVPKSIDTFEQGGIHCMDEIKQHFGVEE